MNEYDDLLRRCAEGDVEATQRLDTLIAAFAAPCIYRLRQDGFPDCDIEDAMREVWRKAYTAIREGNGPIGYALRSWTKKIAIRESVNCVRRRRIQRKHFRPLEVIPESANPAISDEEVSEKLQKMAIALFLNYKALMILA